MKVIVLGGDGFCGWPCAVNLSEQNHEVIIVDNLSRRKIDIDLEVESLTPISSINERLAAWEETGGKPIKFINMDISKQYLNTTHSNLDLYQHGCHLSQGISFQPPTVICYSPGAPSPPG